MFKFSIQLTMLSDWHIGTGAGRPGNVDRLVARDHDGFPFVPAKTLTGIWRDAAERAALALDDGNEGAWSQFVDVIFGSEPSDSIKMRGSEMEAPVPSKISISPARFSVAFRSYLNDPRTRESLTFIKASNSIDPKTGAAREDFLRFEEMARMDAVLRADCELDFEDENELECARHLLVASAMLVERLGGKRRRGAGKCKLLILGEDEKIAIKKAVDYFQNNSFPPKCGASKRSPEIKNQSFLPAASGAWVRIPLTLKLITPLSIVVRTVGNVAESLEFVPGTYLLPHVTRVLEEAVSKTKDIDGIKNFRSLVSSGDIQVLHAYPRVNEERGLPVPGFLYKKKESDTSDGKEVVFNRAILEANPQTQLKDFRNGFISFKKENGTLFLREVETSLFIHNTIQNDHQRPMEGEGGVYSREAIPAGMILETEVRLRESLFKRLPQNWEQKLGGGCRIGVSKKDDYGKVLITVGKPEQEEFDNPEAISKTDEVADLEAEIPRMESKNKNVTVWLLSDLLLRDASLRPTADPAALAQELGLQLKLKSLSIRSKEGLVTKRAFVRRLDSWNTEWGLPRQTLVGIQAGSCFVFQSDTEIDPNSLKKIQLEGIGERRAEGYGRIALNHPMLSVGKLTLEKVSEKKSPKALAEKRDLVDDERAFLKVIEVASCRKWIGNAVLVATDTPEKRKERLGFDVMKNKPPMSQLGGLRQALQRLNNQDKTAVIDWIHKISGNPLRSDRWPEGSLTRKILPLFESSDLIWDWLFRNSAAAPPAVLTLGEMKNLLWAEAVKSFLAAAIRAHKRDLEKK